MLSNVKHFDLGSYNGFVVNRAYFDAALHAAVADDLSETAKADRIYEAIQRGADVAASGQLKKILASEVLKRWIRHHQIMVIQGALDSCRLNRRVRPGTAPRRHTTT